MRDIEGNCKVDALVGTATVWADALKNVRDFDIAKEVFKRLRCKLPAVEVFERALNLRNLRNEMLCFLPRVFRREDELRAIAKRVIEERSHFTALAVTQFADQFWLARHDSLVRAGNHQQAWNITNVACLAEVAFTLPGRDWLCKGNVEDEPIGLCCSIETGRVLVGQHYEAMLKADLVPGMSNLPIPEEETWGPGFIAGTHIATFIGGRTPVDVAVWILGRKAIAIAEYLASHRTVEDVPLAA